MSVRIRQRTSGVHTGSRVLGTTPAVQTVTPLLSEYCEDVADQPGQDHAFYSLKRKKGLVICSGWNGLSGGLNVSLDNWAGLNRYPVILPTPSYDTNSDATMMRARTNPGRPHVNIGLYLAELRDIPRMLQIAGRNMLKRGANAYLAYEFGWVPLIGDLMKFTTIPLAAERRRAELKKLYETGGLKRRMVLHRDQVHSKSVGQTLNSVGGLVIGDITKTTSKTVWATCRWRPSGPPPDPDPVFGQNLNVFRSLSGMDFRDMRTSLWDALPWSWLVGWCSNYGDFLQATNNSIAHSIGSVNVMTHNVTKESYAVTSKPSWISVSTVPGTVEYKIRNLGSTVLTASIPILSNRQLSILRALSITRMRGVI